MILGKNYSVSHDIDVNEVGSKTSTSYRDCGNESMHRVLVRLFTRQERVVQNSDSSYYVNQPH